MGNRKNESQERCDFRLPSLLSITFPSFIMHWIFILFHFFLFSPTFSFFRLPCASIAIPFCPLPHLSHFVIFPLSVTSLFFFFPFISLPPFVHIPTMHPISCHMSLYTTCPRVLSLPRCPWRCTCNKPIILSGLDIIAPLWCWWWRPGHHCSPSVTIWKVTPRTHTSWATAQFRSTGGVTPTVHNELTVVMSFSPVDSHDSITCMCVCQSTTCVPH